MTYQEAFDYLVKSYTVGKKRSFEDLLLFLERFDSPQEKLKIIHVAGTNGKGSTCAMLAGILCKQGYRTGMFTSPDLHKFNERFSINGEYISDEDFAKYMAVIKETSELLFGDEMVSFFQLLTLIAFMYFYDEKVDFLLLETGIGGRLDSTNIITKPVLSIITAEDYDHMEILGDTIEQIVDEDCGIIKKNCPCVLYLQGELVYNVVKRHTEAKEAELFCPEYINYEMVKNDLMGMEFAIKSDLFTYPHVKLKLLGEYQVYNTATVLTAVVALRKYGVKIDEGNVLSSLAETTWAGRMEVAEYKGRTVIFEGAHNAQGTVSLAQSMQFYARGRHTTLLAAIMKDKEYASMVNGLMQYADSAVLTRPVYGVRAASVSALYHAINDERRVGKIVVTERDCRRALACAVKITPPGGIIVCAGSLYLVGDVRAVVKGLGERY